MMKIMEKSAIAAAALLALVAVAGPANAADLPMAAAPVHPALMAPVPVYNWTGLYVGVNGGYAWGNQDPFDLLSSQYDRSSFGMSGGLVGGTIGAQIQQGMVVIGAEGDLDWSNIKGSGTTFGSINGVPTAAAVTVASNVNAISTLRLRVGAAMNNWLLYGTAGVAFANTSAAGSSALGFPCGAAGLVTSCSSSSLRPGMAAGAGVEWGITPNWSAKVEYIYVATMGTAYSVDRLDTVRAGINYRFGGM